ncbi:MAG: alanine racemase [Gammaproteobacteria bacterium]
MAASAVATIRPAALRNNLARVRMAAPDAAVLAVVKANAYGHGVEHVVSALDDADAFGVARIAEALELRDLGVDRPIVVMSEALDAADFDVARAADLKLVIHSEAQVELLAGSRGAALGVWLKLDSGMGRLGIRPARFAAALERLRGSAAVDGEPVLMTHFASADEPDNPDTERQLARFAEALSDSAGDWAGDVSLANSAGILRWPASTTTGSRLRYAGRNWVRPGLMLYGVSPVAGESPSAAGLEPAMVVSATLIDIRHLPAGSHVGYGGEWEAPCDSRIGVLNAGYADGYPWRIPTGTPTRVAGEIAPVVGRISMDMISIDLTDSPAAAVGDSVELWGEDPHVAELAARVGQSPYELLTGVGTRVKRVVAA